MEAPLPKDPPPGLLESMALRYRHDFGLDADSHTNDGPISVGVSKQQREAILRVMRQLYEEVSGHGFFQWPK